LIFYFLVIAAMVLLLCAVHLAIKIYEQSKKPDLAECRNCTDTCVNCPVWQKLVERIS
jgi:hypothetical protein